MSKICLNDQGGQSINIENDLSPTLRAQDHGHSPIIMEVKGTFRKTAHPQNKDEGQGWESTDRSDTLNVFDNSETRTPTLIVHGGSEDDIASTLFAAYGTKWNGNHGSFSGGNFVIEEKK